MDNLYVGFGYQHLVRSLRATEQGANLIALCAALGEYFDEDYAAKVLSALVDLGPELQLAPSLGQWNALVKTCSGNFVATPFPVRLGTLRNMSCTCHDKHEVQKHLANIKDLAGVLDGLGKLSKGELVSMTVSGGNEAGWVTALAEWLFDLYVRIEDENSVLKYLSTSSLEPQLTVQYRGLRFNEDTSSALTITNKMFHLHYNFDEWIVNDRSDYRYPMSSRVPWDQIITQALPDVFPELMKHVDLLGGLIGSIARVFEAIAKVETGTPFDYLRSK
ncbi:hypothetical protein BU23DRAFT_559232 [Bimuria novae-zelandiae CBS 107.79]|uniref:Uncharacterized protein n=1 Tax=Bimuria novae-zelandiae CBS 107.79 TaxID=1447943 RepID=A0A6A5UT80_9PLEO|nr:hypothetical protein BU23DRAFT_559232 [Bimuria novae-zelandiae CBS 107.79]